MEEIKIERLKNVLDSLSNVVAMPEEKKQQTIDRFSKKSDKEAITELAKAAYKYLKGDEAQGTELPIYGNWSYTNKTALVTL